MAISTPASALSAKKDFHIFFPPASAADDASLVAHLVKLISDVYTVAEEGIFGPDYKRTDVAEVQHLISTGQLALASKSTTSPLSTPSSIVGCVRIQKWTNTMGEFGMLVASLESRGSGLGGKLIRFAEDHCRGWGATAMKIELLVPTTFQHKLKGWVQAWYEKLGYVVVRSDDFAVDYPHLAPLLCTKCDYRVFEKPL